MLILIDGFWASGKTTLRYLLDGHSELKVSPSQESIVSSFERNKDKLKFFSYKDVRLIRKILADSYYYNLEQETVKGYFEHDINRSKLSFNFYEFEKYWVNKLINIDQWNNEKILNIIYSSIIKFYYNCRELPLDQKKVIVEDNNFNCHRFFLQELKDTKIITVKRSAPDILASLLSRKVIPNNYLTYEYQKYNFNYLVRKHHFPIRIKNNNKITKELKKEFSERIYECDFKNLIYNTEEEMKKISNFLNINYEEILSRPTHFGENVKFNDDQPILNKEKYLANNTFSKYEINLIKQFDKYNFFSLSFIDCIFIKIFYIAKLSFRKIKNLIKYVK
jgi:hypothetical protein